MCMSQSDSSSAPPGGSASGGWPRGRWVGGGEPRPCERAIPPVRELDDGGNHLVWQWQILSQSASPRATVVHGAAPREERLRWQAPMATAQYS